MDKMVTHDDLLKKFKSKKILITGHTGFKGSWLVNLLYQLKAEIKGIGLKPKTKSDIFYVSNCDKKCDSVIMDIRDKEKLQKEISEFNPDFIFHLAAQPLVIDSYIDPDNTFSTNITGTINLLEIIRLFNHKCTVIMVTTDKVYENKNWSYPYREVDTIGGHDPYSASKAAMELIISSYNKSFFKSNSCNKIGIATARAGNVIGGGDYSENRIIPDIIRSYKTKSILKIRNPHSIRPWQHVLEALYGYLILAYKLNKSTNKYSGSWNFGPNLTDQLKVSELIEQAEYTLGKLNTEIIDNDYHETNTLLLDISKSKRFLSWNPKWTSNESINKTMEWYLNPTDDFTQEQINEFLKTNYINE